MEENEGEAKPSVDVESVRQLPESEKEALAVEAIKDLPLEARKSVVTEAVQMLPNDAKNEVANEAFAKAPTPRSKPNFEAGPPPPSILPQPQPAPSLYSLSRVLAELDPVTATNTINDMLREQNTAYIKQQQHIVEQQQNVTRATIRLRQVIVWTLVVIVVLCALTLIGSSFSLSNILFDSIQLSVLITMIALILGILAGYLLAFGR